MGAFVFAADADDVAAFVVVFKSFCIVAVVRSVVDIGGGGGGGGGDGIDAAGYIFVSLVVFTYYLV